jgi:hypothetical protein
MSTEGSLSKDEKTVQPPTTLHIGGTPIISRWELSYYKILDRSISQYLKENTDELLRDKSIVPAIHFSVHFHSSTRH